MTAPAKHLTLRNVPVAIVRALDRARRASGRSLNQTAIESLGRGLGVSRDGRFDNGLGKLAGTWTESDLRSFEAATSMFEKVEAEVWK